MRRFFRTSWAEFIPPAALIVFTGIYLVTSYGYEPRARLLPVTVAWLMLGLLTIDLIMVTNTPMGKLLSQFLNPAITHGEEFGLMRQVSAIFWPCLFTLLLVVVGVLYAIPIYVFASMRFHGCWSYIWSAVTAFFTSITTWLLFEGLLQTRLYPGLLNSDF